MRHSHRAQLRPGFDIVADAVRLRDRLSGADFCVTGEGRLDISSFGGKAAVGVARVCADLGVPCHAIVGSAADDLPDADRRLFGKIVPLQLAGMSVDDCINGAAHHIEQRATDLLRGG